MPAVICQRFVTLKNKTNSNLVCIDRRKRRCCKVRLGHVWVGSVQSLEGTERCYKSGLATHQFAMKQSRFAHLSLQGQTLAEMQRSSKPPCLSHMMGQSAEENRSKALRFQQ